MNEIAKKKEEIQPAPVTDMQVALLEIVKRTDIDPERLEKFLDLQAKMEAKQAEREFNEALSSFQGECPVIEKTKRVEIKSRHYNYTPIEELVAIIRPFLQKHRLSFSFDIQSVGENKMMLVTTVRHGAGHSQCTHYYFDTYHDDANMNKNQRAKSSVTYAKRAALENALGIVTGGEDDDGGGKPLPEVTPEQIAEIKALLQETDSNEAKFLSFIKAESIDQLTPGQVQKSLHALKQKRGKK